MALLTGPVAPQAVQNATPPEPMYDPTQLQARYGALQKATEAGDTEAAQYMKQQILGYIHDKVRPAMATEGVSKEDLMRSGIGAGLLKPAQAVRALSGRDTSDYDEASRELGATPQGQAGEAIGEQAAMLPVGMGAGRLVGNTARLAGKAGLAGVSKILSSSPVRAGLEGAAMGAASTTDPEEQASAAVGGGLAGAGLATGGMALRRIYSGSAKVTDAARALRKQGVDLTMGQSAPTSATAQYEEAATTGPFGNKIKDQRQAGAEGWQDLVMKEAGAPGQEVPGREAGGNLNDRLRAAYKGFEQPYQDAVKGTSMYPAMPQGGRPIANSSPLHKTFESAVNDPNVLATDAERATVKKFLDNQLSLTPVTGTSGDAMQGMRSNIRRAAVEASKQGDYKSAALLINAEKQVSTAMEAQLSPAQQQLLKTTDAAYSKHRIVSNTVGRAKDMPEGFTPTMLQNEIASSTPSASYARGGGNSALRQLSQQGKQTLDARIPVTGARNLLAHLPLVGPTTSGAMVSASNSPAIKPFLLGETRPQRAGQFLEKALTDKLSPAGKARGKNVLQLLGAMEGNQLSNKGDK